MIPRLLLLLCTLLHTQSSYTNALRTNQHSSPHLSPDSSIVASSSSSPSPSTSPPTPHSSHHLYTSPLYTSSSSSSLLEVGSESWLDDPPATTDATTTTIDPDTKLRPPTPNSRTLPRALECQLLSDRYSISVGRSWGSADTTVQQQFTTLDCQTQPSSCQTLSDVYLISPRSAIELTGTLDDDIISSFKKRGCKTYPSFDVRLNTTGVCTGVHFVRKDVETAEEARRVCIEQLSPQCRAYSWSDREWVQQIDGVDVTLPANSLLMCDQRYATYELSRAAASSRVESASRLRTYILSLDASKRCDESTGTGRIITDVMTSAEARALCDEQRSPPCTGYTWTGVIGRGRDEVPATQPTPYTALLCASFRDHSPLALPADSGYETGTVIRDYLALPQTHGRCSSSSRITTLYDITSLEQAMLECDQYDGRVGRSKCLGFVYKKKQGKVKLCAGVHQEYKNVSAAAAEDGGDNEISTHFLLPTSCQEISNRYYISYNTSWGISPAVIRTLYTTMHCTTVPTGCQQLSNFYGLRKDMTTLHNAKEIVERVPGSIRDLWLYQQCTTSPEGSAMDRQKRGYQQILTGIQSVDQSLDTIDQILKRVERMQSQAPVTQAKHRENIVDEIRQVRKDLEKTTRRLKG